jgi:hypothetical protein
LKGEIDASPVRDLRTAVKSATVTFGQLTELRRIVNEKYDDHRVCRVLVRLPYLLDRGTVPRVFDTIKHVSFTQEGAMRRFVFTDLVGLRPGNFRIALVGQADQNYVNWPEGTVISASVLVTAAAGGTPRNVPANLLCERPDQRNFTIDLDQMTTSGMSTIRVDVMSRSEVFEHAVLYRLYDGEAHPTIVEPVKAPEAGTPSRSRLDGIRVSI